MNLLAVVAPLAGAVLAASAAGRAQCGTLIFPGLPAPSVWTPAGSPYCIMGDVTLAGITVMPGVEVHVTGDFSITLSGSFSAVGSAAQPIRFTAAGAAVATGWGGVRLSAASGIRLEHCELRDGNAGVLNVVNSAPILRHCVFAACANPAAGGAMVADVDGSDLVLEDCTFLANRSAGHAGAIRATMRNGYDLVLRRCHFLDNHANRNSGATHNVGNYVAGAVMLTGDGTVEDCVLRGNSVTADCGTGFNCTSRCEAGALYLEGGDVVLRRCQFESNLAFATERASGGGERAFAYGGAVAFRGGAGRTLTVLASVFTGNQARSQGSRILDYGGAIYAATGSLAIANATLARNLIGGDTNYSTTWHQGGAVFAEAAVSVQAEGTIAFANVSRFNATQQPTSQLDGSGTFAVTWSCVEGGHAGTGNITANPEFIGLGASAGELILGPTSPCIDSGRPDPSADDCLPPGKGTSRNDIGAWGGPEACGWPTAAAFALQARASRTRSGSAVELRVVGGAAGLPTGLVVTAVNGSPLVPPLLTTIAGVLSPRPEWGVVLPVPAGLRPGTIAFRAVSLTPAFQLLVSGPADVVVD